MKTTMQKTLAVVLLFVVVGLSALFMAHTSSATSSMTATPATEVTMFTRSLSYAVKGMLVVLDKKHHETIVYGDKAVFILFEEES